MTATKKLMDKCTKGNVEVSIFEHDSKLDKTPHYTVTCVVNGILQPRNSGSWSLTQAREDMYSIFKEYTN